MAKLAPTSIKYLIKAEIKAKGIVEKPDVIGAVFGQTEGILGSDLDLRELQRTGRIGRIEVNLKDEGGASQGEVIIPSSLDAAETALIAATLETIERVGPCAANIKLVSVEDTRSDKRKYVVDKAKEILRTISEAGVPNVEEVSEQIKSAVRTDEITNYEGMPCGPNILESESIIIVEGRADVLKLLKYGIRNGIAVEGTSVPDPIKKLSQEKSVTVFVDGDRGGELIIKELSAKIDMDFVTRAPEGKEVEDLSQKEIFKSLREKIPFDIYKKEGFGGRAEFSERRDYGFRDKDRRGPRRFERKHDDRFRQGPREEPKVTKKQKDDFKKILDELVGTRAACILDDKGSVLGRVPAGEVANTIKSTEGASAVVLDGTADGSLAYAVRAAGVKYLVGTEKGKPLDGLCILEKKEL